MVVVGLVDERRPTNTGTRSRGVGEIEKGPAEIFYKPNAALVSALNFASRWMTNFRSCRRGICDNRRRTPEFSSTLVRGF